MVAAVCREPTRLHRARPATAKMVAKFQAAQRRRVHTGLGHCLDSVDIVGWIVAGKKSPVAKLTGDEGNLSGRTSLIERVNNQANDNQTDEDTDYEEVAVGLVGLFGESSVGVKARGADAALF